MEPMRAEKFSRAALCWMDYLKGIHRIRFGSFMRQNLTPLRARALNQLYCSPVFLLCLARRGRRTMLRLIAVWISSHALVEGLVWIIARFSLVHGLRAAWRRGTLRRYKDLSLWASLV